MATPYVTDESGEANAWVRPFSRAKIFLPAATFQVKLNAISPTYSNVSSVKKMFVWMTTSANRS